MTVEPSWRFECPNLKGHYGYGHTQNCFKPDIRLQAIADAWNELSTDQLFIIKDVVPSVVAAIEDALTEDDKETPIPPCICDPSLIKGHGGNHRTDALTKEGGDEG